MIRFEERVRRMRRRTVDNLPLLSPTAWLRPFTGYDRTVIDHYGDHLSVVGPTGQGKRSIIEQVNHLMNKWYGEHPWVSFERTEEQRRRAEELIGRPFPGFAPMDLKDCAPPFGGLTPYLPADHWLFITPETKEET